ncbi:MAG: Eco57I restriction-modification methylase domain-containing protein [Verrucomicrobiales bacterium]|nr:Eco57I restriction-modification methylase domain-containing protein [Verrucomicrobiales bacterium]MBP9224539.1 Eco57I restriction-modification methylase domain-containing protein [Verrucomicrobiales bacterium]HQZ29558.1 Eco57I restriction-modification methylase domain-containing protein [Verrucomicrobiales bacterium]
MPLIQQPRKEAQRQVRQREIDALKSAEQRNRLGQFATPYPLALEIADYLKSLLKPGYPAPRFGDPSLGSGSFYSAALAVFGHGGLANATGVELDPAFADAAESLWGRSGLHVIRGDFTRVIAQVNCPASPDLILANPPYVRHHHLNQDDKLRLQALVCQRTGIKVSGLSGLYVYFLLLATTWMAKGGMAAWLIPSEFMDVNYGSALRDFLSRHVTLIRLHRFDPTDVQFGDALVTSAIVVFKNTPAPSGHQAEFTFGGSLANSGVSEKVDLSQLRETEKWSRFPRHADNDRTGSNQIEGPCLGDFFRVQRGIATGCNAFFVMERSKAGELGIPGSFLRPILPSPRHMTETVIKSDRDGYPQLSSQLALLDCNLPEDLLAIKHPELWHYLQTADSLEIRKGYILRNRTPWYKQEQRQPAPFLCTYMGRGTQEKLPFRFIWNRSQAIATNLYLMLRPIGSLAAMLTAHPERAARLHEWLGNLTGSELRSEGRVYGGGLNKIEPKELARISARSLVELWPELVSTKSHQLEMFAS